MRPSRISRRSIALAAIVVLAAASSAVADAAGQTRLKVLGITVDGQGVRVTILNPAEDTVRGSAFVLAATEAGDRFAVSGFEIPGGQKACVEIDLPAAVHEVIRAGVILDDGSPF